MTNEKTSGPAPSGGNSVLGRLGRFSMFFVTAGFAYPNVFVENIDCSKYDAQFAVKTTKV